MVYDTERGASQFDALNIGGTDFKLLKYITKKGKKGNTVNCYDQAAALQSLLGGIGINLSWYYLAPYGYINKTNLVGIGLCNNPFFKSNGTLPVIDDGSPARTAFGNHSFTGLIGKIFDACAGPHLGTESLRNYMESAIDVSITISAIAPGMKPADYWKRLEDLPNPLLGLSGVS